MYRAQIIFPIWLWKNAVNNIADLTKRLNVRRERETLCVCACVRVCVRMRAWVCVCVFKCWRAQVLVIGNCVCVLAWEREREREVFLNGENVWFEECVTSPLPSLLNRDPQSNSKLKFSYQSRLRNMGDYFEMLQNIEKNSAEECDWKNGWWHKSQATWIILTQ